MNNSFKITTVYVFDIRHQKELFCPQPKKLKVDFIDIQSPVLSSVYALVMSKY